MTHVNAYKMDVEDAYNKAVNALSEFKTKVDDLQAKHDEDAAATAEATPPAPAPATDNAQVEGPSNGADDAPVGPGTTDELKQKESDKSDRTDKTEAGSDYSDKTKDRTSSSSVTKSK